MIRPRFPRAHRRRGVALLAALWLVVIITTAGLQFATVARERRSLGLSSADRSRDVAALEGALAHTLARLEMDRGESVRARAAGRTARQTQRLADPWQSLPIMLAAPVEIGMQNVTVHTTDLGTVLNVNLASERQLATLFTSVLDDEQRAITLAQAVLDWRDPDTVQRPAGAEAERYARAGVPIRPANGPLQSLDDLQDVLGFTPTLVAQLRPYLTVDGTVRRVNVNAAPAAVLRTLPGMTEPMLSTILALRARARRVESIPALLSAVRNAGTGSRGERDAMARDLTDAVTLEARDVALTFSVAAPKPQPARLTVVVHRNDDGTVDVGARRW